MGRCHYTAAGEARITKPIDSKRSSFLESTCWQDVYICIHVGSATDVCIAVLHTYNSSVTVQHYLIEPLCSCDILVLVFHPDDEREGALRPVGFCGCCEFAEALESIPHAVHGAKPSTLLFRRYFYGTTFCCTNTEYSY